MTLREHTIFFRCSTHEDLLHDAARLLEVLERVQQLCKERFAFFQDLGAAPRQRPRRPVPVEQGLQSVLGECVHLGARFLLSAHDPESLEPHGLRLEIQAGAHPYTGLYRTALDLRMPEVSFEDPVLVESFVTEIIAIANAFHPFIGHAHSTDDNAIQNITNPGLLERGFGVHVDGPIDIRLQPGREVNRGELRYAINWLTLFGPDFVQALGPERFDHLPAGPTLHKFNTGLYLLRLYPSPLTASLPEHRALQARLWEHLGFEEHVRTSSYNLGFWDRKNR